MALMQLNPNIIENNSNVKEGFYPSLFYIINNSMVQVNSLQRQPTELDYADPTKVCI